MLTTRITGTQARELKNAIVSYEIKFAVTLFIKDLQSILFLHVPKCGGSSIDRLFKDNGYSATLEMRGLPPQDCLLASPQHQTSQNLKSMINMKKLEDIFIMVRNPYKRIISEFNWQFKDVDLCNRPEINSWITESLDKASRDLNYSDNHFRPSLDFIETDLPCNIFRLEDGVEFAVEYFLRKNGSINSIDIPNDKNAKSFSNAVKNPILSDTTISAINRFYRYDFEAFGYKIMKNAINERRPKTDNKDEDVAAEEKIKAIKEWRTTTLNTLYDKIQKELDQLHTKIFQTSNLIDKIDCADKLCQDKIQKSIEARFGEIELKLSYTLLKLNAAESSEKRVTPNEVSNMIKLANKYRHQSRIKYYFCEEKVDADK